MMTVLLLPFHFEFLLFLFLVWLLRLGLLILCWIKVVRMGILVLFLNLRKCFQLFTVEYDVSCGFIIYGLYCVEVCSLYTHFVKSLYHKWILNFVKSFFYMCWDDHMISFLHFVNVVYHTDWFVDMKHPCTPGINSSWSWGKMLLMYCWIPFAVFPSVFISDIGL